MDRNPYDGKPYYCAECGCGLGEFMACDDPECHLELEEVAKRRAEEHRQMGQILADALARANHQ